KIGPDPRNFNQRVSLGRNDLLIRTFPNKVILLTSGIIKDIMASELSSEAALCITTSIPFSLNL
ncbi:hypothetical protein ACRFFU_27905, partial [Klebsiella pneumoniae]